MAASFDRVWPELSLSWRSVLGSFTGFLGAALGSAGGVGGGSVFIPTTHLILGFDTKSSTALSKCMIMGAALATVGYNLRQKHPLQADSPVIDYDIALLFQPMLLLGISIGVIFNTVFPTWILTLVLISVLLGTAIRTSKKALLAWERESLEKKLQEEQNLLKTAEMHAEESNSDYQPLDDVAKPSSSCEMNDSLLDTLKRNVKWKNVAVLLIVWATFLVLQILQSHSESCSTRYWILNSLQVPVSLSAFFVAAIKLYRKSQREDAVSVLARESAGAISIGFGLLGMSAAGSLIAGMVGGLLGLGGGFALGPLLLEFGVHPQVFSATATFAMLFSSSMSVVEYHLLDRFPVPYALYLFAVSMVGGISGQYVIQSLVKLFGRASIIIILLTSLCFLSAFILGGLGLEDAIGKWKMGEYMGFASLC